MTRKALRTNDSKRIADDTVAGDRFLAACELVFVFISVPRHGGLRKVQVRSQARRRIFVDEFDRGYYPMPRLERSAAHRPHSAQFGGELLPQSDIIAISQRPLDRCAPVVQFLPD